MSETFMGEIKLFAGNFAPRNWAFCDGQLLSVSQYSTLFSILGTTYGGDGRTTFALPDFRGRTPVHAGRGPGLSDYRLGQRGGNEETRLNTSQLPAHSHSLNANHQMGDSADPTNTVLAKTDHETPYSNQTGSVQMSNYAIGNTGSSQPIDIRQPYIAANYIIALEGTYPSRS